MLENIGNAIANTINNLLGPLARFLEHYVWAWPQDVPLLAVLLLGTGVFITVRLGFVQLRGFKHAIDIVRGKYDNDDDDGDLAHFQALTTALSATVGIGNIAGVAIAIRMGGPGALFWMWVTAFLGMALKFAECTLAVMYRKVNDDGSISGGPMYYIEKGLGERYGRSFKGMAMLFAFLAMICSFGTGNMNQANTMADQLQAQFGIAPIFSAMVFSALVAVIIIGGIKRIGRVTSVLAPAMAAIYVGAAMIIIFLNAAHVPSAFGTIIGEAFSPTSMVGGAAGSFLMTLMWGIRRGLFSNEAGQGSAPIAHATAKTDEPVREGLVASLEPFIDTLVICTMTGLVIVMTGAFREKVEQTFTLGEVTGVTQSVDDTGLQAALSASTAGELQVVNGRLVGGTLVHLGAVVEDPRWVGGDGAPWSGQLSMEDGGGLSSTSDGPRVRGRGLLNGAPMTARAFQSGLPGSRGNLIVTFSVLLFAVSTAISWSYYGDRSTEYLFGSRAVPIYRWVYIGFFFVGCLLPLQTVWIFGDVALGLMSFPNLLSLILLSGLVAKASKDYFARQKG